MFVSPQKQGILHTCNISIILSIILHDYSSIHYILSCWLQNSRNMSRLIRPSLFLSMACKYRIGPGECLVHNWENVGSKLSEKKRNYIQLNVQMYGERRKEYVLIMAIFDGEHNPPGPKIKLVEGLV